LLLSNIIRLVDEIITTKRLEFTQDTTEVESKLDQLIYELYGLNEEEIEIIESSINGTIVDKSLELAPLISATLWLVKLWLIRLSHQICPGSD